MQALIETFRSKRRISASVNRAYAIVLYLVIIRALIAIPLAIYLTSHRKLAESLLQVTGIFQTIPSLALLAY